jgi:hypothetical protein
MMAKAFPRLMLKVRDVPNFRQIKVMQLVNTIMDFLHVKVGDLWLRNSSSPFWKWILSLFTGGMTPR